MALGRELPETFELALKMVREILSRNIELLKKGVIDTESEQILTYAYRMRTGKRLSRLDLFARSGDRLPLEAAETALVFATARSEGRLLQHLTGVQAFLDHEYDVGPDVLVPRPETELLVSLMTQDLKRHSLQPALGLEIGLGSGIIAIELLCAFQGLRVLATELTQEGRDRARQNARKILGPGPHGDERLEILRVSHAREVCQAFEEPLAGKRADFLVSNPPYLASPQEVEPEVLQYEPASALFAPADDPLFFYREIAQNAEKLLVPGGRVYLELASERSVVTAELFKEKGWTTDLIADLAGRDRVLIASR